MSPEVGRAASRFAVFLILTSAVLIPLTEPESAERVLSVVSCGIGILFLVVIAVIARVTSKM